MIKLLPYILSDKIHLYFSIGNGQPSEPALCQLYRHTFVLYPVHVSLAIPERYLADLCVPAASTDGRRKSRSAVSGVLLVPSTRTSTGFAAYLEPTTNGPPITRIVGLLVQAPQLAAHLFQHYTGRPLLAYGSRTFNRPLAALRSPELALSLFKRQLKTDLFQH